MAQITLKRSLEEWDVFCKQVQNATAVSVSETKEEKDKRKALVLKDYESFVQTYFPNYADSPSAYFHIDAAKKILADPNIFFIAEWPREHAKTVHMCLIIPMWLFIHGEVDGLILMSRNEDMACNALGDVQAFLQYNKLFINDWGAHHKYGDWASGDFTTKDGVRFLALGRDQAPQGARKEGKRPNIAVFSDLDDYEIVNNQKRVLQVVSSIKGALYPCLAIKAARMIGEGNRIHPKSIIAHMVGDTTPVTPKDPEVTHSKVYATEKRRGVMATIEEGGEPAWKERYTIAQLSKRFKKVGPVKTKGEYYHQHSIEGTIFKDSYIHWRKLPNLRDYSVIVGYFDPSFENKVTSDFKAISIWGKYVQEKHAIKKFCRQIDLPACFQWMSAQDDKLPSGVAIIWLVENQFFNGPIKDALFKHNKGRAFDRKPLLNIVPDLRDKENKYTRIVRMEADYVNNDVYYNIDEIHNHDMIMGNNQLKGIEPGYTSPDDSPDADEGAWYYLNLTNESRHFTPIIGLTKPNSKW